MNAIVRDFRDFFVSLKLTVVLLVLGMLLVFVATLDQVNLGVWAVQEKYFRSLFVMWRVGNVPIPVFPGGYVIGGLLLINLVAAHIYRFKFAWRKTGIVLAHLGLILLLVGELLTSLWQQEYNMRINEGETKNYAESYQRVELAVADVTDPATDEVVAIPESRLARHETIQHPKLPFRVVTKAFYPNASLGMRPPSAPEMSAGAVLATTGIGQRIVAVPEPITYKQEERNTPAAYVELLGPQGSVGTWMVSAQIPSPQHFDFGGRSWKIALRFKRAYKPFSLTLLKFSHDVYPGTEIPKNFSSRVRLQSNDGHDAREVLIYMNNPLRYAGLTFYQSGYEGEHTTILQVVRNPSWMLPYVACLMVAVGLVIQFGIHLFGFIGKRRTRSSSAPRVTPALAGAVAGAADDVGSPDGERTEGPIQRYLPFAVLLIAVIALLPSLLPQKNPAAFNLVDVGRLPILANGRVKPLDTVARSSLLQLQNRQEVRSPNVSQPLVPSPTAWLLDAAFRPEKADTYPTFVVDNPDLLSLIGRTEDNLRIEYTGTAKRVLASVGFLPSRYRRFAFQDIAPHVRAIEEQAKLADQVESGARNPFQRSVLQLYNNLLLYQHLRHMFVMPGHENFVGELLQFQQKLGDGVAAVRAKQANQPHDEALVKEMVEMGQAFDIMASASNHLVIPPERGENDPTKWQTTGAALLGSFQTGSVSPSALAYAGLARAWRDNKPEQFNQLLSLFRKDLEKRFAPQLQKSDVEVRFNVAEPFYKALSLFGFAFVAAIASWLVWPRAFARSAFGLMALAWIATTAGILTRMWLEGVRP